MNIKMLRLTERTTPMLALILLFLSCLCAAEHKVKCSNRLENSTTMKPSEDGVRGRYTIEWCTNVNEKVKQWNLELTFNRKNSSICTYKNKHSSKTEYLKDLDVNHCSHVCLSTDMDLIFSTCYIVQNWFPSQGSMRFTTNHNISNDCSINTFSDSKFTANTIDHGDYISAHFYLGSIPATEFDMQLCKKSNNSYHDLTCSEARRNCSAAAAGRELECALRGLRPGAYELRLTHRAPWVGGDVAHHKMHSSLQFRVAEVDAATVDSAPGTRGALLAACAALGALAAAAALLAAALRWRRAAALRKHVLRAWLHREEEKPAATVAAAAEAPGAGEGRAGDVLLLYAREGPAADACVQALTQLLETVAPGQVYDLHSPATAAAAAAGGGGWLRAALARAGTRVLLLQTPALRLHRAEPRPAPAPPTLQQPLLGAGGVYRSPAPADWLLADALRLLGDAPHAAPYTTHYLATLEGLETEVLPYTVPYRRYRLPAHAPALLRDLAPAAALSAPQRALVDALARAAAAFVDHARANPHYLRDQLLLL